MKALLASLVLVPLAAADFGASLEQEEVSCLPEWPSSAELTLRWDDTLDGRLDAAAKRCTIRIDRIDGSVTGRFAGPVLGSIRNAMFTGEIVGEGSGSLMILQQREHGYVCSYQLIARGGDRWVGTWCDSRGATGTVGIAPPEPRRSRPHSQQLRSAETVEVVF